jgi:hypothetical protein
MYDKDLNFGEHFNPGDRFVVLGLHYNGEINTSYGPAKATIMFIVTRESPTTKQRYMALGEGFAAQAMKAEPGDFPHVAEYVREPRGSNEVKLLARVDVDPRKFIEGDDGPPLPVADPVAAITSAFNATDITPTATMAAGGDIGF